MIRPLETVLDADLPRGHVGEDSRDEKRADLFVALPQRVVGFADVVQVHHAHSDGDARAGFRGGVGVLEVGVFDGFFGGEEGVGGRGAHGFEFSLCVVVGEVDSFAVFVD